MSVSQTQEWFEMREVRKRNLDSSVWVPLRASQQLLVHGEHGTAGHRSEFFGAATLMVDSASRAATEELGWSEVGLANDHVPYIENDVYVPADVGLHHGNVRGHRLVISQRGNGAEHGEWHLHHDFVVGLSLKREGDVWVAMDEGYVDVVRLHRNPDGRARLLEVRTEFLKDYLAARGMALYVNSYRDRTHVFEDASHIAWAHGAAEERVGGDRWRGHVHEIHEGGMPFGAQTAVFHVVRNDVDADADVPLLGPPTGENVDSRQWIKTDEGRKLYTVRGELWRSEWVEPGPSSPRVRGDKVRSTVTFAVDASGHRECAEELEEGGKWLWFRPHVIEALCTPRGGGLEWYTAQTGAVGCAPDGRVHFGINERGLVNVYAKDIAYLPEWQQRIWSGFNVAPDGGLSKELADSQIRAEPAETLAPEEYLLTAIQGLNAASRAAFGFDVVSSHADYERVLEKTHRFRATDEAGLYELAKDVARLTADSINAQALHRIVPPPNPSKPWGSIKSLEKVLAKQVGDERARAITAPLVGAYELRLGDAHLPGSDIEDSKKLVKIDVTAPHVFQGFRLLQEVVSSLFAAAQVIDGMQQSDKKALERRDPDPP